MEEKTDKPKLAATSPKTLEEELRMMFIAVIHTFKHMSEANPKTPFEEMIEIVARDLASYAKIQGTIKAAAERDLRNDKH